MFKDITNDESDHWNPMTDNPIVLESQVPIDLDDDFAEVKHHDDASNLPDGVEEDVSPTVPSVKKRPRVVLGKSVSKTKSSTAVVMQEHVKRIADNTTPLLTSG